MRKNERLNGCHYSKNSRRLKKKLICARHRHGMSGKFIKLKIGHSSMGIFVLRVLYLFRYRQWSEIWYGLNVFFKVNLVDIKLAYNIRLMFRFHALLDCVCLLPSIVCISLLLPKRFPCLLICHVSFSPLVLFISSAVCSAQSSKYIAQLTG